MNLAKGLAIVIIVIGVASMAIGIAFLAIGASTSAWMSDQLRQEQITLGASEEEIAAGEVIDTAGEAQRAGDIVRSHRHEMSPTYGDLTAANPTGRFDPTDPEHLTYGQALNLENYLYLAVASFGLTNLAMGLGAALFIVGVALVLLAVMVAFLPDRWRTRRSPMA